MTPRRATAVLFEYPKKIDAIPAVVGVPHQDFGEGVTAVVVTSAESDLIEAVVLLLEQRLAAFKPPKRVIFAEDLPRNTMGKVQNNLLRATYADLYHR